MSTSILPTRTAHHTTPPLTPSRPSPQQYNTMQHNTTHHTAGKCETIGTDPEESDGIGSLDGDTALSHGSFLAAMHAAGSVCEAVDMVVKKKVKCGDL
jgi:acetoin utilization deacetylase AcuC-like enzyme